MIALLLYCTSSVKILAESDEFRIIAFGDSLCSGYGLPLEEGFVPQLQRALAKQHAAVTVINHCVAGETSAEGYARTDWMLQDNPDLVIVEFGGNDFLRAIVPAATEQNLDGIVAKIRSHGATALLAGMHAPANLGQYKTDFENAYIRVADKYDVDLFPFFLEGVALDDSLNQPDGTHPNAQGVAVIVKNIYPYVAKLLRE